jgi:glutamyl-tRNA(Gln) amidotransferase subunit E
MKQKFDPLQNYEETRQAIGYLPRKEAEQKDWDRIGFMSGLEVHQQLKTREKLFCHCPAGLYQKPDEYDAELIRHMRPTLSELGEYDGTALMEFRTRKQIIYHIKNETACTYDVDDTPPFPLNREALGIALEISLLTNLKIVGEVHITRKQYLDGSIPTGFQRTAIIGVEGEIQLRKKKVRIIQLSIEEDSCREVSDIGHVRVYRTDRLGMPLIETVTYPDFTNPDEVKEGADYIRYLNRSTGKVRTGIGSTRADVNVSCRGGTRVEIKGVAHTSWMPELTHNEAFRQWALLHIKEILNKRVTNPAGWNPGSKEINITDFIFDSLEIPDYRPQKTKVVIVNLPGFHGILSHFTQPGRMFGDELSGRLKVVACIEIPNMVHSEMFEDSVGGKNWEVIRSLLGSDANDAQLIIWGPEEDIPTALETIEERCRMAFHIVPNETRKSFEDGTTIFERVLPGADRMYPDTDSAPIPLDDEYIRELEERLPPSVSEQISQLTRWNVPEDCFTYILKNNLVPLIDKITTELSIPARFTATLFAHTLKHIQRNNPLSPGFSYSRLYELMSYLKSENLDLAIAKKMIGYVYRYPEKDFDSILNELDFKEISENEIKGKLNFFINKFKEIRRSKDENAGPRWVMGKMYKIATGNISLKELSNMIHIPT